MTKILEHLRFAARIVAPIAGVLCLLGGNYGEAVVWLLVVAYQWEVADLEKKLA